MTKGGISDIMNNMLRYAKRILTKELWAKARAAALVTGKTFSNWLGEAIQEKLDKEKK